VKKEFSEMMKNMDSTIAGKDWKNAHAAHDKMLMAFLEEVERRPDVPEDLRKLALDISAAESKLLVKWYA
jgi:hypothetical protein